MTTTMIERTASTLTNAYRQTHDQFVNGTPESRVTAWQEYVEQIKSLDVNDPSEQIEAKAGLDSLEQLLFASVRASGR